VLVVFYTAGWGAVLTVVGTLGGVAITQAANTWSALGTRRKERNDRINDAVVDLIACGSAWVYALEACQQRANNAVTRNLDTAETLAAMVSARAEVHSAQVAYGRALAKVRLGCPLSINSAASDHLGALQAFDREMVDKVAIVLETRNVDAVQRSVPDGVNAPQDRLVKETRKQTGRVILGD
jgi:hypothetical protein